MQKYGVIYKITNKVNGKIYIGQTTRTNGFNDRYRFQGFGIERVYKYYISRKQGGKWNRINDYLVSSIEKYGFDSFEVEEEFDIAYSELELNEKEEYYIKKYNCTDKKYGYNTALGGKNHKMDFITKQKISVRAKERFSNGFKPSFLGKKHSVDSIEKIRIAKKGTQVGSDNPRAIKIICLNTMEIFECGDYACEKYNLDNSNLVKALSNPTTKSCGSLNDNLLRWQYYSDYLISPIDISILSNVVQGKKIICLNDFKVFDSAKQASEFYNCDSSGIIKVCRGVQKEHHKLIFKYYTEFLK